MCHEASLVALELLSESNPCAISFCGGLFLFVPYFSKYLPSHPFLEDLLMRSGVKFDPSYSDLVQAIQDWLISKSAFEEESFRGSTSFYKKFNKELNILVSPLVDVAKRRLVFHGNFVYSFLRVLAIKLLILLLFLFLFEIDYGDNFLMSFSLVPLSIDHVLSLDKVTKMEERVKPLNVRFMRLVPHSSPISLNLRESSQPSKSSFLFVPYVVFFVHSLAVADVLRSGTVVGALGRTRVDRC
ncbi:hypothetical protein M9H77_06791 [Catharanthus roseus]|uniref:Uncharacterized protein n=1 Tax=Catharanthus roseus TaxID=4058 RepID=A0ACC0BT36_CATRO|nr:hypothetical protein M9H77_06791 [Catharanthus roseus]